MPLPPGGVAAADGDPTTISVPVVAPGSSHPVRANAAAVTRTAPMRATRGGQKGIVISSAGGQSAVNLCYVDSPGRQLSRQWFGRMAD
ncbi:hypothetical protein GCM10009681_20980 [Luedemannella helvata]|uniref:Uncharacterized protein n=1 Tax=Luedemannella helvata TaxID=349315 RepID=A0ABN2K6X4_9ACTN